MLFIHRMNLILPNQFACFSLQTKLYGSLEDLRGSQIENLHSFVASCVCEMIIPAHNLLIIAPLLLFVTIDLLKLITRVVSGSALEASFNERPVVVNRAPLFQYKSLSLKSFH